MSFEIKEIGYENTYHLRKQRLNPSFIIHQLKRPGDEWATHLGAFLDNNLVGIASFYKETTKDKSRIGIWRIRGMVVDSIHSGKGYGNKLLSRFIEIQGKQLKKLWCNAREDAIGFYENFGFENLGQMERLNVENHLQYRLILNFE